MSRPRAGQTAKPSWSRQYAFGVAMGSPTRGSAGAMQVAPLQHPDQLRPVHPRPFDLLQRSTPQPANGSATHAGHGSASGTVSASAGMPAVAVEAPRGPRQLLQSSASASTLPSLPGLSKSGGVHGNSEAKQQPQQQLQSSSSSPNLLQSLREQNVQRNATANQLVQSFHTHYGHYEHLLQKLTRDLAFVLERTKGRDELHAADANATALCRERTEGVMEILRQLAASSPHASTFTALVEELHLAIYNHPTTSGVEFREFDPDCQLTFWQLCALMDAKSATIASELEHVQARANYYEFHESGERNVMLFAVDKWQSHLVGHAFDAWRTNVRTLKAQRNKMHRIAAEFERRTARTRLQRCFLLWKFERVRAHRAVVGPRVVNLSAESTAVSEQTTATNAWINAATNALKDLATKLSNFQTERGRLELELERLQNDVDEFKALKLQDVANFTLEVARELMLSLQDEIEYHLDLDQRGPFRHDGYAMLERFKQAPKLPERADKEKKGKKGKKAAAAAAAKDKEKKAAAAAIAAEEKEEKAVTSPISPVDPSSSPTAASVGSDTVQSPSSDTRALGRERDAQGSRASMSMDAAALEESMLTSAQIEERALNEALAAEQKALDEADWDPRAMEAQYARMSEPEILLHWFNFHLRAYHWRPTPSYDEFQPGLYKRVKTAPVQIGNLSSDLCTTPRLASTALLMLLEQVSPLVNHRQSMNYLLHHEVEADLRAKGMLSIVGEFDTDAADVLPLEVLMLNKAPDLCAAFVGKLFVHHPTMPVVKSALPPLLEKLEAMKLARRHIYARLANISLKHAEFDAVYARERDAIEVSRIQATRFLKTMDKQELLKVHQTESWNAHAKEEEERLAALQAARDAEEARLQAERDAQAAKEKAEHEERIRQAKENLGLVEDREGQTAEAEAEARKLAEEAAEKAAAADKDGGKDKGAAAVPDTPAQSKRKTRKQLAMDFERNRLAREEEARKAAEEAAAAAAASSNTLLSADGEAVPELDPFSPEEALVYVEYIRRFAVEFHEVYTAARKHMERIRRGEAMYLILQRRVQNFIMDVLVRRVQHDPVPLIDAKAQRDFVSFTTLVPTRITDVFPQRGDGAAQASDIMLMQSELVNDYEELCSIFRAYSRVENVSASSAAAANADALNRKGVTGDWSGCLLMSARDYSEWTKDLKILTRTLKQSHIDEVFNECIRGKVVSRMALAPPQFVEAIVRLAALRYPMPLLADSLALFLKQDVLKRSKKIAPDLLRNKFASTEFLELMRKHRRKLRKVFLAHASGQGSNSSLSPSHPERNTLDLKDLIHVIKLAKLLGGGEGVSADDITVLYANVKRAAYVTHDNPPTDPEASRLDYAEFCQAMVAVAMYKNPDPFTPLFQRLDHFFTRDFFPANK